MSELDKLGIKVERVHQTSSTSVQGVELGSSDTTKLTLTLPSPVKIKATFTPESIGKKVIKLFNQGVSRRGRPQRDRVRRHDRRSPRDPRYDTVDRPDRQ